MSHLIFCDEFGNTGPNLFDLSQPVFLYAFLVIARDHLQIVEAETRRVCETGQLDRSELKSSRLWSRAIHRYSAIGEILAQHGAHACISVVEKRYQACSMIVETYLDPVFNEHVPVDVPQRLFHQTFADAAYDSLHDDGIKDFLAAVHADNPQMISDVGRRISGELRSHSNDLVKDAAVRMELRDDRVFRYCQRRPELPRNSHIPASQYAVFHPGIEKLDRALETLGAKALLIRDDDRQFKYLLDVVFSYAQKLDDMPEVRAYGAQRQLSCILGCRNASSAEEFGLQLADLAAGLFGRIVMAALAGQPLDPSRRHALEAWRPLLLPRNDHYWMLADATMDSVIPALFD